LRAGQKGSGGTNIGGVTRAILPAIPKSIGHLHAYHVHTPTIRRDRFTTDQELVFFTYPMIIII
jgi:hypothetical protein